MIWGFVDYENTGSLAGFQIDIYERLFVFCGPKNNSLKLGEIPTTEFTRVELISVKTTGANNLDFHLAFYIGRLHESANEGVEFHIISNDTGFNGLISHLKKIGRKVKRIPTKVPSKPKENNKDTSKRKDINILEECTKLATTRLKKMDNKKRPTKEDTLINWLNSQCRHKKPSISATIVFEELKTKGKIKESKTLITYQL